MQDRDVEQIMQKYKKRLSVELGEETEPDTPSVTTREYEEF